MPSAATLARAYRQQADWARERNEPAIAVRAEIRARLCEHVEIADLDRHLGVSAMNDAQTQAA